MANLDPSLMLLLREKEQFEKTPSLGVHPVPNDREIPISITFTGDFSNISAIGFRGKPNPSGIAFGNVDFPTLKALAAHPQVVRIDRHLTPVIHLDKSVPDIEANLVWGRSGNTFSKITGKGVILGIIDTGIDILHPVFRDPVTKKTRILWIWDQTIITGLVPPLPTEKTPGPINTVLLGNGVYSLGYGVEYDQNDIQQTIDNPSNPNPPCRHKDMDRHGTHVAGISGGNGSQAADCGSAYDYVGVAPEASFVIVRMWGLTTGDNKVSNPSGTGNLVTDAVAYILSKAKPQVGTAMPVAINCSFGSFYSALMHNHNPLIVTIEALLASPNGKGIGITFSAGNDANKGLHMRDSINPAQTLDIPLNIPANDKPGRDITFWYPKGSTLTASITSPFPTSETLTDAVGSSSTANGAGSSVGIASLNADGISTATITPPPNGTNFSGTWVIHLQNTGAAAVTVDGFCEYASGKDGYKFGDLSPANPLPVKVTPLQTMSTYSCGSLVMSTGAYAVGDHTLTAFSSRGPTRDTVPVSKPDICAPGLDIHSARRKSEVDDDDCSCCCACCLTWYFSLSGTSQASPHVAGTMALMLQANPQLSSADIKTALTNNSNTKPPPAGTSADDLAGWGAGRVDANLVVTAVTPFSAMVEELSAVPAPVQPVSLQQELLQTPNGKSLAGLVRRHFPEIMDLINHNRRVATIWHRVKGPVWTRLAAQAYYNPALSLKPDIDGLSLTDAATRFLAILRLYASAALLGDIAPFEPVLAGFSREMTVREMIDMVGHFKQETAAWPPQPVH